jgi:hypothetical protein
MKHSVIWTNQKIKNIAKKHNVNTVYLCLKNGSDALAVFKDELLIILPKSRVAPTDAAFNARLTSVQDMRRVSEKFKRIKDGVLKIHLRFDTFASAAQYVSAKHSARSKDWKEIKINIPQSS